MQTTPRWLQGLCRSREPVYIVNDAQRIVCWNEGAQRLLGYSEAEVLNQPCYQIIGGWVCGKTWCRAGCAVQRSAKRGVFLQHVEMYARTRSGDEVCVNASIFTLERSGRQFTIHLLRDMTREEHTREVLESFFATLHSYGIADGTDNGNGDPRHQIHNRPPRTPSVARLTRREIEVLELLADGLSTKDVALRLGVSFFTVRRHVETVLLKTGMHTQAQAVAYPYRTGLL